MQENVTGQFGDIISSFWSLHGRASFCELQETTTTRMKHRSERVLSRAKPNKGKFRSRGMMRRKRGLNRRLRTHLKTYMYREARKEGAYRTYDFACICIFIFMTYLLYKCYQSDSVGRKPSLDQPRDLLSNFPASHVREEEGNYCAIFFVNIAFKFVP